MSDFFIKLTGPNAEADAEALRRALNDTAQTQVAPQAPRRGMDAVVIITVSAAMLQSIDIIYRFYQDWQTRQQRRTGSHPQLTIVRPDGTRIELASINVEQVKALLGFEE